MSTYFHNASDALDAAADYIEKHGWYQGGYCNLKGEVCAAGALNTVIAGDPCWPYGQDVFDPSPQQLLLRHINKEKYCFSLSDWNDAPERTVEEVIATMRNVAANQRKSQ